MNQHTKHLQNSFQKQLSTKIKLCFERALEHDIYFPCIISILPKLYLEDKNYEKAIQLYHQLINANPNEFSYYKILSELYFRKRDYESASDVLSKLIELAPYKSEELIQPIENIVKKIPRHTQIRILYANILFRSFKPI